MHQPHSVRFGENLCLRHEFIEPGKPVQNAFVESFNGACERNA